MLFWGSPDFAVPTLRALLEEGHEVVGVVTQPDRPAGRGRGVRPSAVRRFAEEEGLPVLTPERPRGEAFLEELRALEPEVSVVVAYGHILGRPVLELPPRGSINVHASLLPELRGAAPVHWAVIRGFGVTGVTIMRMTEGMDAGPILLQAETPIGPEESTADVLPRLSEMGAGALVEALNLLEAGLLEEREQDASSATFAPKLDRALARVDWDRPAREVADWIRGMDGGPGAWDLLGGAPVKLFRPVPVEDPEEGPRNGGRGDGGAAADAPGTILPPDPEGALVVRCGMGAVRIGEVQLPGGRRMAATEWLRGLRAPGPERFGG